MNVAKIIVNGTEREVLLGIEEGAIERREKESDDTIDLQEIIKDVNEETTRD